MHCPAGFSGASVDDLDSNVLASIHSIIASNFRINVFLLRFSRQHMLLLNCLHKRTRTIDSRVTVAFVMLGTRISYPYPE